MSVTAGIGVRIVESIVVPRRECRQRLTAWKEYVRTRIGPPSRYEARHGPGGTGGFARNVARFRLFAAFLFETTLHLETFDANRNAGVEPFFTRLDTCHR
jgi:hypothetical protein